MINWIKAQIRKLKNYNSVAAYAERIQKELWLYYADYPGVKAERDRYREALSKISGLASSLDTVADLRKIATDALFEDGKLPKPKPMFSGSDCYLEKKDKSSCEAKGTLSGWMSFPAKTAE